VIKDALTLFREDLPLPDTGNIRNDLLYIAKGSQELFNRNPFPSSLARPSRSSSPSTSDRSGDSSGDI